MFYRDQRPHQIRFEFAWTGQFYLNNNRFSLHVIVRSVWPRKGLGLEFTAVDPTMASSLGGLVEAGLRAA